MLLIAAIAGLIVGTAEHPNATTSKVVVDGATYRVRVQGEEVEVAAKSLFTFKSLENRDRMRRAVSTATGCQIVDELAISTSVLQGRLVCGKR